MNIFEEITSLYKLKSISRDGYVDNRNESTAEHTWSMFILADYFLNKYFQDLDKLKIYQMIIYHDITEIKFGDIPLNDLESRKHKKELEVNALAEIEREIPNELSSYIVQIVKEYEDRQSKESKFVKAIDFVDADLNCYLYKFDYKGKNYSKKFLLEHADEKLKLFPEIYKFYVNLLDEIEKRGDFN